MPIELKQVSTRREMIRTMLEELKAVNEKESPRGFVVLHVREDNNVDVYTSGTMSLLEVLGAMARANTVMNDPESVETMDTSSPDHNSPEGA
jgi:hypothetical protein